MSDDMSVVECYLTIRSRCDELLNYYDMLIHSYDEQKTHTTPQLESILETEDCNDILNCKTNTRYLKAKKIQTNDLKERCTKKLKEICQHSFVQDFVETGPERSESIMYCEICNCPK